MSDEYRGIRWALRLAMQSAQPVNVSLNKAGAPVRVEGVIQGVYADKFEIQLEEGGPLQSTASVPIAEVEYVEYS